MLDIGNDIFYVFDTDREADQVWRDAGLDQLLIRKLAMRMARGMKNASTGIGDVCDDSRQLQVIHETDSDITSALQAKREDTA